LPQRAARSRFAGCGIEPGAGRGNTSADAQQRTRPSPPTSRGPSDAERLCLASRSPACCFPFRPLLSQKKSNEFQLHDATDVTRGSVSSCKRKNGSCRDRCTGRVIRASDCFIVNIRVSWRSASDFGGAGSDRVAGSWVVQRLRDRVRRVGRSAGRWGPDAFGAKGRAFRMGHGDLRRASGRGGPGRSRLPVAFLVGARGESGPAGGALM